MNDESAPSGLLGTLRAGVGAGLRVGIVVGLVDAAGVAAGFDSEFFALELQLRGAESAFPSVGRALAGLGENLGNIAATASIYGVVSVLLGLFAGFAAHPLLRRQSAPVRARSLFGAALGLWLALALWWWTRPVVFAGFSALHPLRLLALTGILVGGQLVGFVIARSSARLPSGLRRAAPVGALVCIVFGGWHLMTDAPGKPNLGQPTERTEDMPNVLLFVVDALRADVIQRSDVHTPVLDGLARRGVLFENAMVQAPFTWTSFGSLLTGKYPRRHGLVKMEAGVRMRPNVTFPYYLDGAQRRDGIKLQEEDYVSAAFMTGTLSHGSGLLRGFDVYCEALVGHGLVDVHSSWSRFKSQLLPWLFQSKLQQRVDRELVASTAIDWFATGPTQRFMSMVHFYSTHTPYDPIEPYRSRYVDPAYDGPFQSFDASQRIAIEDGLFDPTPADLRQIKDLYHGGVTMADAMIGRVLDELKRQGRLDNTIVIVTSDHGEELGEHGLWEHNFMYQTNLRIPLIIAWPDGGLSEGQRVSALVESVDVFPTLCDLMQIELPVDHGDPREAIDGVSLVPLMRNEVQAVKRYSYAENGRYVSIQDLEHKLIVRWELHEDGAWENMLADPLIERPRYFDLTADPGEFQNLFDERIEPATELFKALRAWNATMPIAQHELVESARDQRNENLMRGLGYSGGVGQGLQGGED